MSWDLALSFLPLLAGAAAGFLLGRRTGKAAERVRELEAKIEGLHKEHELALAEIQARKEESQRRREELDRYRGQVTEHFSGTSDLLRELTLRYRAVYDHLAEGAQALCPEGALALEVDLNASALTPSLEESAQPDPEAEEPADSGGEVPGDPDPGSAPLDGDAPERS